MAQLLNDISWGEPILPALANPAWEAEVKRRGGQLSEVDRRIQLNPWMREFGLGITTYRPVAMPPHLFPIGAMVTSQENACRYCYGANRAYMKILGYSESVIQRIERDLHVAELDDMDRGAIAFCRNLARSRPRPSRAARDGLVALGFSPLAVNEMAFVISAGCFYNRVSTFIACPPEQGFERMANGPIGRLIGLAAPLTRALDRFRRDAPAPPPQPDAATLSAGRFGPILAPLAGLPGASIMRSALEGAFASDVLDNRTKALMFAVVARTLGCDVCEGQSRLLLDQGGMAPPEIESALGSLRHEGLPPGAANLLAWTRGTVYYDVAAIQHETRTLAGVLGDSAVLEAVGVAALANAAVRMAMLHE